MILGGVAACEHVAHGWGVRVPGYARGDMRAGQFGPVGGFAQSGPVGGFAQFGPVGGFAQSGVFKKLG